MAQPLPNSDGVANAFRLIEKMISKEHPANEQAGARAALMLLRRFLDDVHTIAMMAKRQQGLKEEKWNESGW
jgi:hypothetical protein